MRIDEPRIAAWPTDLLGHPNQSMGIASRRLGWLEWQGFRYQLALLLGCWLVLVCRHWDNDGLWFQGDAPRHVMNGIFWRDLIHEGLADPYGYAREYYKQYPAIIPNRYPPLFYFMEVAAFECFGNSAYVAKGLVQLFALVSGFYLLIAMRRWISPGAGSVAGLLMLLPGMVAWSNAVMLNVPAMAFSLGALFHVRRGIETKVRSIAVDQFILAIALGTLAVLFHPTIGYVLLILGGWVLASNKASLLLDKRLLIAGGLIIVGLVAMVTVILWVSPEQIKQANVEIGRLTRWRSIGFYIRALPELVGWPVLFLSLPGLIFGWFDRRFRSDAWRLLMACMVAYLVLSLIWAKDARYLLLACPACVWCIGYAAEGWFQWMTGRWNTSHSRALQFASVCLVGGLCLVGVREEKFRNTRTFESLVSRIEGFSPDESVLYDGVFDGVFVYYVRIHDPLKQRKVVLARKILSKDPKGENPLELEERRNRIIESGCRWLFSEQWPADRQRAKDLKLSEIVGMEGMELIERVELGPSLPDVWLVRIGPAISKNRLDFQGSRDGVFDE